MKSNRRDILKTLGVLSAIGSTGVSLSEPVAAEESIAYEPEQKRDLFVDPDDGNDDWSGGFIEPRGKARGEQEGSSKNSGKGRTAGNDGPLETIQEAIDRARDRALGNSYQKDFVNVWLLGGRYELDEPITIEPYGSETEINVVAYEVGHDGEGDPPENSDAHDRFSRPVISGGREITGWEETTVNGSVEVWKTTIPEVRDGDWEFHQLFVDGERRRRPILPDTVAEGLRNEEVRNNRFQVSDESREPWGLFPMSTPGDSPRFDGNRKFFSDAIDPDWRNLQDVEIHFMFNFLDEIMPIESYDPETNLVTVQRRTHLNGPFSWGGFFIENVFEELSEPGEWYLDRETGELYYAPKEGESMEETTIVAPKLEELLSIEGDTDSEEYVENLNLVGLEFRDTLRVLPPAGDVDLGRPPENTASPRDVQANKVRGSLTFQGLRCSRMAHCTLKHTGTWGLAMGPGCVANRIVKNEIADTGAGSLKTGTRYYRVGNRFSVFTLPQEVLDFPLAEQARENQITDNHLHHGGRVFFRAAGLLANHTYGNALLHNEIHDYFYSGHVLGGNTSYKIGLDRGHRVRFNHVYNIGNGLLGDMGGYYLRGRQPGTEFANNLIHDGIGKGCKGLYGDQSVADVVFTDNIVYEFPLSFQLSFGAENLIENNVFADAREGLIRYNNPTPPVTPEGTLGLDIRRNVLAATGTRVYLKGAESAANVNRENNLLWNLEGEFIFASQFSREEAWGGRDDPGNTFGPVSFRYDDGGADTEFVTGVDVDGVTLRNDYPNQEGAFDYVGMAVTVGDEPIEVTHLGRYVVEGNEQTHKLKIVAPNNESIATVPVDTTQGTAGDFLYAELDSPVTLESGTTYYVVTQEFRDGDEWYNSGAEVTTTDAATVDGPRFHFFFPTGATGYDNQPDSLADWQEQGLDIGSIIADPQFVETPQHPYGLADTSPAFDLSPPFEPIDMSTVGPREELPPAPPYLLSAEPRIAGNDVVVDLSWETCTDDLAGFEVLRGPAGQTDYNVLTDTSDTTATDTEVTYGDVVDYAVIAIDEDGERSVDSAPVRVNLDPVPELEITETTARTVTLSWTEEVVSGYRLKRGTQSGGPYTTVAEISDASRTSYEIETPEGDDEFYVVTSVLPDGSESDPSNEVAVEAIDVETGLRVYYSLDDEGAVDAAGNANAGTLQGGVTPNAEGIVDEAFAFDGDSGSVDFGTDPNYDLPMPLTVSVWIRPDSWGDRVERIFDRGQNGAQNRQGLSIINRPGSDGVLLARYGDGSGNFFQTAATGPTASAGEWHHVAWVVTEGDQRIYVDGELSGSSENTQSIFYGDAPLVLARNSAFQAQFFDGKIDEFRLYDRELSESSIRFLATEGTVDGVDLTTELSTYYPLDDAAAEDATGNGNAGTLNGGVTTDVAGQVGQAFDFDGADDYVEFGDDPAYEPDFPCAVSAWIKPDTWADDFRRVFDKGTYGGGDFQGLTIFGKRDSDGVLIARYGDGDGNFFNTFGTGPTASAGAWHHVAWILTEGEQRIYVDGKLSGTSSHDAAIEYGDEPLVFGTLSAASRQFFDGKIDDVRLYDRELSETEVGDLSSE